MTLVQLPETGDVVAAETVTAVRMLTGDDQTGLKPRVVIDVMDGPGQFVIPCATEEAARLYRDGIATAMAKALGGDELLTMYHFTAFGAKEIL